MLYFYEGHNAIPTKAYEEEDKLLVKYELPGISKEDINISYKDNVLTVQGKKEKKEEKTDFDNFKYGSFSNQIKIYTDVDFKNSNASFVDGVLTIQMPKKEEDIFKLQIS